MNGHGARWLIDIGNTRIKCASCDARGMRGPVQAFAHGQAGAIAALLAYLRQDDARDEAWLASVAPAEIADAVEAALRENGYRVHRVRTMAQCGSLRIAYDDPARLGVDRFLALLAACARDDGPWLIVSAGSALTVDLLDAGGEHLGGLIAPTAEHMRAALAQRFSQLDLPEGRVHEFAGNSADAIASGTHAAVLGLVERSLGSARKKLGAMPTLLITGGGVAVFDTLDHPRIVQLPALVLDGLAILASQGGD